MCVLWLKERLFNWGIDFLIEVLRAAMFTYLLLALLTVQTDLFHYEISVLKNDIILSNIDILKEKGFSSVRPGIQKLYIPIRFSIFCGYVFLCACLV